MNTDRIIRETERRQITGVSRTQWWRMEHAGHAPKRFKLSPTGVAHGWSLGEVLDWIEARKATRA